MISMVCFWTKVGCKAAAFAFIKMRYIHLIQKRLSTELLHCALCIVAYPDRKAPWM